MNPTPARCQRCSCPIIAGHCPTCGMDNSVKQWIPPQSKEYRDTSTRLTFCHDQIVAMWMDFYEQAALTRPDWLHGVIDGATVLQQGGTLGGDSGSSNGGSDTTVMVGALAIIGALVLAQKCEERAQERVEAMDGERGADGSTGAGGGTL